MQGSFYSYYGQLLVFFKRTVLLRLVKNIFFLEICGKLSNKSTVYAVYKEKSLLGTNMIFTRSSGLVVRSLDSQYRRSGFKTAGWVLGQLSLSAFRSRSNEHLELLVSYWLKVNFLRVVAPQPWDGAIIFCFLTLTLKLYQRLNSTKEK